MEHITTFMGEDFTPLAPDMEQIRIEDIAHALSLTCRANGHITRFYSVAQHCINCANEAKARGFSPKIQLACLLHDGSEAYLSDITRPVKGHLPEYLKIEKTMQDMIYEKYLGATLTGEEYIQVEHVDDDMLLWEFGALMEKQVFDVLPAISSSPDFGYVDSLAVENMFLKLADSLMYGRKYIVALGIDGCHAGWCMVKLDNLGNSSMSLINDISVLPDTCADIALIDIPIGLSDSGEESEFYRMAKKELKGQSSCVFPVPCRDVIYKVDTYEEACEINKERTGKKISRQSWSIVPKIREVDEFMSSNPEMKGFLVEHHPELCFLRLLGTPCKYNKREQLGENQRIAVLKKHMDILSLVGNHTYSSRDVARDDIIDAAVLAFVGLKRLSEQEI